MRTTLRSVHAALLALALAALAGAPPLRAQAPSREVEALVAAGRFQEAVDGSRGVGPDEADVLAGRILDQAVERGYEAGDYEYALRGIVQAKRLPGLGSERLHELDYWHAWSLYMRGEELQLPGTPAAAETALPYFTEAREIVNRIDRNLYDVFELDSSIAEYIQILRNAIRSG